jgi:hypothetical protein
MKWGAGRGESAGFFLHMIKGGANLKKPSFVKILRNIPKFEIIRVSE